MAIHGRHGDPPQSRSRARGRRGRPREPFHRAAPPQPRGRRRVVAPTFAEDVRRGLTSSPKFLYPKYFYDELGSRLFEAITVLPEYYPTRAEAEILRTHASEIVATLGGPVWLLELGSGDGQKTRLVIEALLARQGKLEYVPVDISESAVEASSRSLLFSYPDLRITGYIGEYQTALRKIREDRRAPGLHARPLPRLHPGQPRPARAAASCCATSGRCWNPARGSSSGWTSRSPRACWSPPTTTRWG